jgi:hypothetical protein
MQIELLPPRTQTQQMLARLQGKETLIHCLWDCSLIQPVWKQNGGSLKKKNKKLNIDLPYDPAIPLTRDILEGM